MKIIKLEDLGQVLKNGVDIVLNVELTYDYKIYLYVSVVCKIDKTNPMKTLQEAFNKAILIVNESDIVSRDSIKYAMNISIDSTSEDGLELIEINVDDCFNNLSNVKMVDNSTGELLTFETIETTDGLPPYHHMLGDLSSLKDILINRINDEMYEENDDLRVIREQSKILEAIELLEDYIKESFGD